MWLCSFFNVMLNVSLVRMFWLSAVFRIFVSIRGHSSVYSEAHQISDRICLFTNQRNTHWVGININKLWIYPTVNVDIKFIYMFLACPWMSRYKVHSTYVGHISNKKTFYKKYHFYDFLMQSVDIMLQLYVLVKVIMNTDSSSGSRVWPSGGANWPELG